MNTSSEECPICLEQIVLRGGKPLTTPGCCGQMFHLHCLQRLLAKECPCCRAAFPPANLPTVSDRNRPFNPRLSFRRPQLESKETIFAEDSAAVHVNPPSPETLDEGGVTGTPGVTIVTTTEFECIGVAPVESFHVHLGLSYVSPMSVGKSKVPLDVVCILDNSGSMQGDKLENLKRAMSFVIDNLESQDRLAIVHFNSTATVVHGLLRMDALKKENSKMLLSLLSATGGTDIFKGMQRGCSILDQRTSRSPSSCMFLLTDGQDTSNLTAKMALATQLKGAGTSFFAFGFGADHDSAHMTAIAEAAEGSFIYIESNDAVVDAFGGAIGAQQGSKLKDIVLRVDTSCSGNLRINRVMSGRYPAVVGSTSQSVSISFMNLFCGETRDVLLDLNVPGVSVASSYPLFVAHVTCSADETSEPTSSVQAFCDILRMNDCENNPSQQRNILIDSQIMRVNGTSSLQRALASADNGDFETAKQILRTCIYETSASASNTACIPLVQSLLAELESALENVSSRSTYHHGGRATMSDSYMCYSANRQVYTSPKKTSVFQTKKSGQSQAMSATYKSPAHEEYDTNSTEMRKKQSEKY